MKEYEVVLRRRPLVKLTHGDCLDVLRGMRSESVDSIVTDPPYGISYRNKKARILRQPMMNDGRPFIWWLYDAQRVLKDGGAMICFCRWDVQEAFRWAIEQAGFKVRSQLVWDRAVHGMGDCRATFAPQHEVMWFATKGRFAFSQGRPKSVITAKSITGIRRLHPTEKPVELMVKLVRAVTPQKGLVLDPCMGSASTGAACIKCAYGFTGVEIAEEHFAKAVPRMRGLVGSKRAA